MDYIEFRLTQISWHVAYQRPVRPLERFRDAEADPVRKQLDRSVCVLGVGLGGSREGAAGFVPGAVGDREAGAMIARRHLRRGR